MNFDELVSVVVPVYNVEKYVARCIKSILHQTYKNIEILIINDGSTDNSLEECNYFLDDVRVKVFTKKNGGLSDARNYGLKRAKGKYICFIDSDDYIHPKYIELLYQFITEKKLDIIECSYVRSSLNDYNWDLEKNFEIDVYSGIEYLKKGIGFPMAWNKMYKTSLFIDNNIYYPYGKYNEDEGTTYKLMYNAQTVGFVDIKLYCYYKNSESIMQNYSLRRLDYIDLMNEKANYFKEKQDNYLCSLAMKEELNGILLNYYKVKNYLKNKDVSNKLKKDYRKKMLKLIFNKYIHNSSRILMFISFFMPSVYGFVQIKILKKGQ